MSSPSSAATVRSVVVVPSALALLPELASPADPLGEVRACAAAAVAWLARRHPGDVSVLAAPQRHDNRERGVEASAGLRIGRALLAVSGGPGPDGPGAAPALEVGAPATTAGLLVVANGSATRSEKAPGHLDERAFAFDDAIDAALRRGEPAGLTALDPLLAEQLWCFDTPAWCHLGTLDPTPTVPVDVDYDDDPFGVRYWVTRWTCGS